MHPIPLPFPILLDGATGSNLIARGLPGGVCVEQWILEHPDTLIQLQKEFIAAGANIIYTPTFSANRAKLSHFGLADQTVEYNKRLTALSKTAAADSAALVAGDMSPTGQFAEPFGDMTFQQMRDIYAEQAAALNEAGADLFVIETMMSLTETRAAVLACRDFGKPVMVTITVDEHGRTLTGASAEACLVSLQDLGVSAFGLNCSHGPDLMVPIFQTLAPLAKIPLIAKPNAGQPDQQGNYHLSPKDMAEQFRPLLEQTCGIAIAGGCCGTTPAHLAALHTLLEEIRPTFPTAACGQSRKKNAEPSVSLTLACETQVFYLSAIELECSEPICCTADMADDLLDLADSSVDIITVALRTPDDAYEFSLNAHMARLPVMFRLETDNAQALTAALSLYPGKALVDTDAPLDKDELRTIAARFGAEIY